MDAPKIFRHHDYELQCGAKPVDSGKFAPTLVVSKLVWPTRPREIDVPRGSYTTEESATEAAYKQGIEWVAHYG